MSDEWIEPPDPELRRLFEAESRAPDASEASKARVWSGVRHSLDGPPPGPGGGGATGGGGAAVSVSAVALVAFVIGAGAGAWIYHLAAPTLAPAPASVSVSAPAPVPAPVEEPPGLMDPDAAPTALTVEPPPIEPVAAPDSAARIEARPVDAGPAPERRRRSPPAVVSPETTLGRERALVDVARAALARGQTASALDAIERHARAFPDGRLVEEREALRVLTLAAAGQLDAARRAADRFRARHPNSLLQRAVDTALGERR